MGACFSLPPELLWAGRGSVEFSGLVEAVKSSLCDETEGRLFCPFDPPVSNDWDSICLDVFMTSDGSDCDRSPAHVSVESFEPLSKKQKGRLLFLAVKGQHHDVVEELLSCGADPTWQWSSLMRIVNTGRCECSLDCPVSIDCLCLAVGRGNTALARLLVAEGAEVTMDVWSTLYVFGSALPAPVKWDILTVLCRKARNPVPVFVAVKAVEWRRSSQPAIDSGELLSKAGHVSWSYSWFTGGHCIASILRFAEPRFLLRSPAVTRRERVLKALFLQSVLLQCCYGSKHVHQPDALIQVLLEQGASAHGWTWWQAAAMLRIWREQVVGSSGWETATLNFPASRELLIRKCRHPLPDRHVYRHMYTSTFEHFWLPARDALGLCDRLPSPYCLISDHQSLPFPVAEVMVLGLLPVVLCYVADNVPVMAVMKDRTAVPWLNSLSRIPCGSPRHDLSPPGFTQTLHDGPTCRPLGHVTEEQSHVTLAMCTCSGGVLPSLQSASRDVILASCMTSSTDLLACIDRLPLPERMKDFIACGV